MFPSKYCNQYTYCDNFGQALVKYNLDRLRHSTFYFFETLNSLDSSGDGSDEVPGEVAGYLAFFANAIENEDNVDEVHFYSLLVNLETAFHLVQ